MTPAAKAERLFRGFSERNSLAIETVVEPNVELMMLIEKQPGLSFDITLALQDEDRISVGFEGFVAYFPITDDLDISSVCELLDRLISGDCRLAVHTQAGRIVKRVLECRRHQGWDTVYTHYSRVKLPFVETKVSIIGNRMVGD